MTLIYAGVLKVEPLKVCGSLRRTALWLSPTSGDNNTCDQCGAPSPADGLPFCWYIKASLCEQCFKKHACAEHAPEA